MTRRSAFHGLVAKVGRGQKTLTALAFLGLFTLLGCAQVEKFITPAPTPASAPAPETQSAPAQKAGFGAIAFSQKTLRWHMRWNVVTPDRASVVAMEQCGAADCKIVLTFGPGQCGTFSLDDLDALAVASGNTKSIARDLALDKCSASGQSCKVAPPQCNN